MFVSSTNLIVFLPHLHLFHSSPSSFKRQHIRFCIHTAHTYKPLWRRRIKLNTTAESSMRTYACQLAHTKCSRTIHESGFVNMPKSTNWHSLISQRLHREKKTTPKWSKSNADTIDTHGHGPNDPFIVHQKCFIASPWPLRFLRLRKKRFIENFAVADLLATWPSHCHSMNQMHIKIRWTISKRAEHGCGEKVWKHVAEHIISDKTIYPFSGGA